jgi:hypothetical protein
MPESITDLIGFVSSHAAAVTETRFVHLFAPQAARRAFGQRRLCPIPGHKRGIGLLGSVLAIQAKRA